MTTQTPPPLPCATHRTSRLAITSLVLGCCILLCSVFSGLPALIFGIAALVAINRSSGQLRGQGMAIAGICLGGVSLVFLPILLGLLFPAIGTARNAANKARASAAIQCLCGASKSYYSEYGKWPAPQSAADLVLILNGGLDPVTGEYVSRVADQNPRKIQFMEFRIKDVTIPGSSGRSPLAFYDPWGTPYAFCFDNGRSGIYFSGPGNAGETVWRDSPGYNNAIPKPFPDIGGGAGEISYGFAFFSNGPDRFTGTAATAEDDIRSWR